MSMFQCQRCGCAENTACSSQGFEDVTLFDWSGIENRKGLKLCSACGPSTYANGESTAYGKWHRRFARIFFPCNQFQTDRSGDLRHVSLGILSHEFAQLYPNEMNCAYFNAMLLGYHL